VSGEGSPSDVPPAAFDRYQMLQHGDDTRVAGSVGPHFHHGNPAIGHDVVARRVLTSFNAAPLAFTLIAGFALGALAGYAAGSAHERRFARVMANAPGSIGRDYTDATVEPVERVPPVSLVPVERVAAVSRESRSEPLRAAAIVVFSRPSGASVTIDGRRIGATPVSVPAVEAGTHVVRIQRLGYRPWVTRVQLAEGARARIGASLVGGHAKE
jgi:hypothetical protein